METGMENMLLIPVEQLQLSKDCIANLQSMCIGNLRDLIEKGWQGLRETEQFDYVKFNEVVRLLADHDMVHLLERSV